VIPILFCTVRKRIRTRCLEKGEEAVLELTKTGKGVGLVAAANVPAFSLSTGHRRRRVAQLLLRLLAGVRDRPGRPAVRVVLRMVLVDVGVVVGETGPRLVPGTTHFSGFMDGVGGGFDTRHYTS
jgi:hypothetical protein